MSYRIQKKQEEQVYILLDPEVEQTDEKQITMLEGMFKDKATFKTYEEAKKWVSMQLATWKSLLISSGRKTNEFYHQAEDRLAYYVRVKIAKVNKTITTEYDYTIES